MLISYFLLDINPYPCLACVACQLFQANKIIMTAWKPDVQIGH